MQSIRIFAFLLAGLQGLQVVGASLPILSDSFKVEAYVRLVVEKESNNFRTTEFVDTQEGSIRLDLVKVNEAGQVVIGNDHIELSFFRLLTSGNNGDFDNKLVALNADLGNCSGVDMSDWPLKHFSSLFDELRSSRVGLRTEKCRDATSIGPTGLLRLVHSNSNSFKLLAKSHNGLISREELHFALEINYWAGFEDYVARLIVTVVSDDDGDGSTGPYELGKTLLSQVDKDGTRVTSILLTTLPSHNKFDKRFGSMLRLDSVKWLTELAEAGVLKDALLVTYLSVQERSLSRHSGMSQLARETDNPFLMPAGKGCGSSLNESSFRVNATQFSGQFEASSYQNEFSVAYDQASNHLRYDLLGEFKLIYSLNDNSVTYVSADSSRARETAADGQQRGAAKPDPQRGGTHCAQGSIGNQGKSPGNPSILFHRSGLESILGLGRSVELNYLGRTRLLEADYHNGHGLPEPITCFVFEREIEYSQIPALMLMHLRVRPTTDNRIFLVYYFVDEVNALTRASLSNVKSKAYESMWLKRVKLLSTSNPSPLVRSNGQLTFSKSSWSLETLGEDTRNREIQLEHPVRTFDLLECSPERDSVQLDMVLKQQKPEQRRQMGLTDFGSSGHLQQYEASLEESLINFVAHQTGLARSHVNEFTIHSEGPENYEALLVRAKLTFPFEYVFKQQLEGWVQTYEPLLRSRQARVVSRKIINLRHECSLNLATQAVNGAQDKTGGRFHMLLCPNFGCAQLLVNPELLETGSKSANYYPVAANATDYSPQLANYQDLCEIYFVKRVVSQRGPAKMEDCARLVEGKHFNFYAHHLREVGVEIGTPRSDQKAGESSHQLFQAQVTKVRVKSSASLEHTQDEPLNTGACYTPDTKVLKDGKPMTEVEAGRPVRLVQLKLDERHSRAHCQQACAMLDQCHTYSFERAKRSCFLSNIKREWLRQGVEYQDVRLVDIRGGQPDCSIHAFDKLKLFNKRPEPVQCRPVDLYKRLGVSAVSSSVLLGLDLEKCASLACSSERKVDRNSGEIAFGHLQQAKICVITGIGGAEFSQHFEEYQHHLVYNIDELPKLIRGGRKSPASQVDFYERYERNWRQFYSFKFGQYVEFGGPTVREQVLIKRARLGLNECLRACILESNCVMLNHCAGPVSGGHPEGCSLYSARSPHAIGQLARILQKSRPAPITGPARQLLKLVDGLRPDELQLSEAERLLYLGPASDEGGARVRADDSCRHYYLAGDNLLLKRLLASQWDYSLDDSGGEPAKGGGGNYRLLLVQTLAGMAIGFAIFIAQPTLVESVKRRKWVADEAREKPVRLGRRLSGLKRAINPKRRSEPSMEQNELLEMSRADTDT